VRSRLAVLAALACAATAVTAASARAALVLGVARDVGGGGRVSRLVAARAASSGSLPYGGGPVLHSNRTHVIFWQPSGSGLAFDPGYQSLIERFLRDVAADSRSPGNVYGLSGQYGDGFGPAAYDSSYAGAVVDGDPLPPNGCVEPPVTGPGWTVCLTDSQLQAEIERVVRADRLPTAVEDVYFLVTPDGLGSCTDSSSTSCALGGSISGYCGYHSQTSDGRILYAVIPYNAVPGHCQSEEPRPNSSTADPALSTISHEHSEMITDPVGDAWINSAGQEDGDLCITSFGPAIGGAGATAYNETINGDHYFLQEEWSNEDGGCAPRDEPDRAWFSTSPAAPGRKITLVAHASDPDASITGYLWMFGDGVTARGHTVHHSFRRAGRYRVTLRTTDSAGNWTFYARAVPVAAARDRRAGGRARRAPAKSG